MTVHSQAMKRVHLSLMTCHFIVLVSRALPPNSLCVPASGLPCASKPFPALTFHQPSPCLRPCPGTPLAFLRPFLNSRAHCVLSSGRPLTYHPISRASLKRHRHIGGLSSLHLIRQTPIMRISPVPNLITPLLYNIQQQNRLYRRTRAQNHRQSRRIMTGRVCKLTRTSIFPTNIFFPVSLWIRLRLQRPKYCFRHGALVVWAYALLTFVWPLSPSSSSFALQTPNKMHLAPPKHLPAPCLQPARVLLRVPPCLRITFADIIVQLTPNKCFTVGSASIFPATFTINLKQSHN
jgi:hypothetical protein